MGSRDYIIKELYLFYFNVTVGQKWFEAVMNPAKVLVVGVYQYLNLKKEEMLQDIELIYILYIVCFTGSFPERINHFWEMHTQ